MKLFVDGQLFQTGALERGMGVLTVELLRAAIAQDRQLEVVILLNDKLPMSDMHRQRLSEVLKEFTTEYVSLETPATGPEERAKQQLETYIGAHTTANQKAAYLVPALFLFDYFALFPTNCKSILIFHDLIPLVMWDHLKNVFPGHVYFARFRHVFQADIILANSANTREELVRLLGVPPADIVVMGGAPENITITKAEAHKRVKALGIDEPYILLPTGGGYMNHKNNLRAAEALYLLQRDSERKLRVVATSRYEPHEREAIRTLLGDSVIFTGNINTFDMHALYTAADIVLVPSLAEGLGIPLLNAVTQGVPVAASNIPVFTELAAGRPAFYEFNPLDVWDMRDTILAALARVDFTHKQTLYKELLREYTWGHCAEHLLGALEKTSEGPAPTTRRLDVLMPDPIASTTDGYVAQSLVAVTRKHGYGAHYYIDPSFKPPHYNDRGADYLRYVAPTYEIGSYDVAGTASVPKLLFLPQDANFTRLHLLSRIVQDAVIYVSGGVSDHLYGALFDDGLIDETMVKQEKIVWQDLAQVGMFTVPHPFLKARAVIVEERSAKPLKKLLKLLKVDCPVLVVEDNTNKDLNDYVQAANAKNDAILQFISEVYA